MTKDEIIRSPLGREQLVALAREAGIVFGYPAYHDRIERFAALVAAHERNRHAWTQEHWTEYEHAIAAAEREACAKVCESMYNSPTFSDEYIECADAIRARSNKE